MTSKLRPPNFHLSTKSGSSSYETNNNNGGGIHLVSLSSYTNQCQKQLALAASKNFDDSNNNDLDDENSTLDNEEVIYIGDNSNNHSSGISNNNSGKDRGSNNEPSMEQCIILLESHLSAFQTSCCQTDKKLRKRKKKKRKRDQSISNLLHEEGDEEQPEDDEEEDEVPPQLLRLARFFHYRWVPIKRALLRPIQHHQQTDDDAEVEIGIKYRLRLAKACYKHGLVAPAEYEMLIASLDKIKSNNDDDDGIDYGGGKSNSNELSNEETLMEKVRLALLRLPTDITTTTTVTSSSSSSISWRHVKEMMLECCRYWEKNGVTTTSLLSLTSSSREDKGDDLASKQQQQLDMSRVVDWALTSWTALILSSEGIDSSCCWESNNNDQISKIEKEFATILSNRQSHTATSTSNINDRNPFQLFATAVSHRINEVLSYTNLKQMSGVHLLSMARLLATFYSSNDAEEHILASVLSCSSFAEEGGGSGGMDCLDSLSRLLAIYCCSISMGANSGGVGGGDASEDSLMEKAVARTTAADLETRLYQKLNDEDFVERVLYSTCSSTKEGQPSVTERDTVVPRAKSFLGVVMSATAHLIKP